MAYLREGYTDDELRRRYYSEAEGLDQVELAARFGRPRGNPDAPAYPFLSEDGDLTPGALRSYSQLANPHYRDQREREYTRYGGKHRRYVYVRLPISKTRQERTSNASYWDRQDFPIPGEEIELEHRRDGSSVRVTVTSMLHKRNATALLEVSADLDSSEEEEEEDGEEGQESAPSSSSASRARVARRIEAAEERYRSEARELGAPEGELAFLRDSRRKRKTSDQAKPKRQGFAAPRAPKAPPAAAGRKRR